MNVPSFESQSNNSICLKGKSGPRFKNRVSVALWHLTFLFSNYPFEVKRPRCDRSSDGNCLSERLYFCIILTRKDVATGHCFYFLRIQILTGSNIEFSRQNEQKLIFTGN